MPFYRFKLEVRLTTQAAMARIKELVAPPRTFFAEIKRGFSSGGDASPPFIGKVEEDSFRVRRDIRYRNSFLPLVWGRINSVPMGTHISVTMYLHPIVAAFMLFWFFGVGAGALAFLNAPLGKDQWESFVPVGMLVFGVALVFGGFFPEAVKARHLLEQAFAKMNGRGDR